MSLPVLPEPTAAPLPVLLDSLRDFVKLALDSDDDQWPFHRKLRLKQAQGGE